MIRDTFDRFQPQERGRFGDNELGLGNVERVKLADVEVALHHATDKALLVSLDGLERRAVWLPKSRVEVEHTDRVIKGQLKNGRATELAVCIVTMKRDFAREKGLV